MLWLAMANIFRGVRKTHLTPAMTYGLTIDPREHQDSGSARTLEAPGLWKRQDCYDSPGKWPQRKSEAARVQQQLSHFLARTRKKIIGKRGLFYPPHVQELRTYYKLVGSND